MAFARRTKKYVSLGRPDNTIYANGIIDGRIARGRVLDYGTLPCWIDENVVRIIKKATNLLPEKRFPSVGHFVRDVSSLIGKCKDWRTIGGCLTLFGSMQYRIIFDGKYFIQRKKGSGWIEEKGLGVHDDISDAVRSVHLRVK